MKHQTPNTKHQTPEKHQKPNTYVERRHILSTGALCFGLCVGLVAGTGSARAEDQKVSYHARMGGKMRIDGTANMLHPTWAVETKIIAGSIEVGPNFPTEPGQAATPGKVEATGKTVIRVNSLISVNPDGTHYDQAMDDRMYQQLKADKFATIEYHLTGLTLKETAKSKDDPYLFDSTGELTIAGVTKPISFPVSINVLPDKKIKVTGTVTVKGSDFGVPPIEKSFVVGTLRTGDDYKLSFDWRLAQATAKPAAK